MRLPVLTFDIETQTDLKSGAHLFGLDLPEAESRSGPDQITPSGFRLGFSAFAAA